MIDCRLGSHIFEVSIWEESEMTDIDVYDLQDEYEEEWDNVACGRYRRA
jgi:hypothetical protein